ncbi:MAG: DoxX-like family protein [Chthoniobacterales bacterium]
MGKGAADYATIVIGALEVTMGLWVFLGRWRRLCAPLQTLALVSMNSLEIFSPAICSFPRREWWR